MVYAFIIGSVTPGEFVMLYNAFFASGSKCFDEDPVDLEDSAVISDATEAPTSCPMLDMLRKERLETVKLVLGRVKKAYEANSAVTNTSSAEVQVFVSNMYGQSEMDSSGIFSMELETDEKPKTIIWQVVGNNLCFILICNHKENRLLASGILKHLIHFILEKPVVYSAKDISREIMLISAIVNILLPCGQLVFMNSSVMKQQSLRLKRIMKGGNE